MSLPVLPGAAADPRWPSDWSARPETAARFRDAFRFAPIGMALAGLDGAWLDVNPALCHMLGYAPDELLSRTAPELTHPDDLAAELAAGERLLAGAIPTYQLELRHLHRDGSPVWTLLTAALARDAAGAPQYIIKQIQDISAQKRAASSARVSEERFRRAFELGLVGMAISSSDASWLEINDEMCAILGYDRSELRQLSWAQITHPDDLAADMARFERLLAGEVDAYRLDKRFVRKDGQVVSATLSVHAVRRADRSVDYVVALVHDMTERVQTEQALRRSEHLYRTLAQQFPNGAVFLIDHDLRFTIADGQSLAAIGLSRERIEGRTLHEAVRPESARIQEPLYRAALAGEQRVHELTTGEHSYVTYYLPVYDGQGAIYGALAVSHDITELKRAQAALAEERALLAQRVEERTADLRIANAELARTARMKDEFLANMSHELRTPLNTVLGTSEALRERIYGALTDRQDRALQTIEASSHHLLGLITDILDVAKVGAGTLELAIESVSVVEVCEASMQMVRQAASKKQLRAQTTLDPQARLIRADARRLRQILVNLLTNAVKFTPTGGAVGLDVAADTARQLLLFTVWDTGIGIAPEQRDSLFQPFVQLDARLAREHEGAGLGLVLVARLSELHGGSVAVMSEVGVGSRFTVALPWAQPGRESGAAEATVAAPPPAVQAHTELGSFPGERATILLVDDNHLNSTATDDYLTASGYRVVVASSGEEALAYAQVVMPDLVLMDIQMPGMDGLETTRRLRAIAALAKMPVIALTALAMPGDRERCLAAGADDYLAKPVSLRVLQQAIASQLQRRRIS